MVAYMGQERILGKCDGRENWTLAKQNDSKDSMVIGKVIDFKIKIFVDGTAQNSRVERSKGRSSRDGQRSDSKDASFF
jgi:hypothetical protein